MPATSTDYFSAVFPAAIAEEPPLMEQHSMTRRFASDVEPFGLYTVEETVASGNAFIAVGARRWVADFGDGLRSRLEQYAPVVIRDESNLADGLAQRELHLAIDLDGPCLVLSRILSFYLPRSDRGIILLAWTFTNREDAVAAERFIQTLQPIRG